MLSNIFRQILLVSLLGSVVAGAILAIKAVLGRRLSPRLHYYIWVVLLLRLAIPFTVDTPISLVRLPPQEQIAVTQAHTYNPPAAQGTVASPQVSGDKETVLPATQNAPAFRLPDLWPMVLRYGAWMWLAGAVGLLLHMAVVNLMFWRRLQRNGLRGSREVARVFSRCKEQMGIGADISLLLCPLARAPMLFGLFRPKVLLSAELAETLTPQQLGYVLLHELTHWKRRDLLLLTLANLLRAIYWFNPLVWFVIARMKQDCEIACDDAVLHGAAAQDRRQYGRTLLDMMALQSCAHGVPGTVGFISNYHRRRINMIAQNRKTSWVCTGAAALVVLAILAGCAGTSLPAAAGPQPTATPTKSAQPSATPVPTPTADPTPTGTAQNSEAPVDAADTPAPTPDPDPTSTVDNSIEDADPTSTPAPTDTPVPMPTPRPTGENRYDVSGIEDPQGFEAWFGQLQNLVRAGDKNAVAAQVLYPIRVKLNQKTTEIKDKAAFVKNYDAIFTAKVKQALLNQKVEQTFVNYKGVMVGQGELWFTPLADTTPQVFVIYGINN